MSPIFSLPHSPFDRFRPPPGWFGPSGGVLSELGVTRGPDGAPLWRSIDDVRRVLADSNSGDKPWRNFKLEELERVVELAQKSERMRLLGGSLRGDLSLLIYLATPAPRWPREGRLRITDHVILHVGYQRHWLTEAPPPTAPVGVIEPFDLFLPNASPQSRSALCLGSLPAGVPVVELIQLAYLAVSAQTMMPDETEGVMNPVASEFYREHPQCHPLTRTGLLEPWSPAELKLLDVLVETSGGGL